MTEPTTYSKFKEFCHGDKLYVEFVTALAGHFDLFDEKSILNRAFVDDGVLQNCVKKGGGVVTNLIYLTLKLHFRKTKVANNCRIDKLFPTEIDDANIDYKRFLGVSGKQVVVRFTLEYVCRIFNCLFCWNGMDWTGLDCDEIITPDINTRHKFELIYNELGKIIKTSEDKGKFYLESYFDISPYFKINKFDEHLMPKKSSKIFIPNSEKHTPEPGPFFRSNTREKLNTCALNRQNITSKLAEKRKFSQISHNKNKLVTKKSTVNKKPQIPPRFIVVSKRVWRYRLNKMVTLKTENSKMKSECLHSSSKIIADNVERVRVEFQKSNDEMQNKIDHLNEIIDNKNKSIKTWKDKYNKLKDDYDWEMDKNTQETNNLLEKMDDESALDSIYCNPQVANFDQQVPQLKMREGLRNINPNVLKVLTMLRCGVGISLRNSILALIVTANNMFGQNWKLQRSSEFTGHKRVMRCLAPTNDKQTGSAEKQKIDNYTAPSISYLKSSVDNVIAPAAFASTFEELKSSSSIHTTMGVDHFVEHREKKQTQNIQTVTEDPNTGRKTVHYRALGLTNVYDTSGASTFEQLKYIFMYGAVLTSDSEDGDDILKSLREILCKVKFAVTDGASNMIQCVKLFDEWKKDMLGKICDIIWIHGNAHVIPAFDSGIEKQLMVIEGLLKIKPHVAKDFNSIFFKTTQSTFLTMLRAIFLMVGESVKNNEWSCKIDFENFLKQLGEPKNRFFNPLSARFGKYIEMGTITAYNYHHLKEFFDSVPLKNIMSNACYLYINCPYFYDIMISLALMYYHFLGPFMVVMGAEKQFGFKNLDHTQLLKFYRLFVKCLQSATTDPSCLIKSDKLSYITEFESLSKIFNKSYQNMFDHIFDEIENNDSISIDVIKSALKLFCEEYLIVIHRQAGKFYVDENCLVEKLLKNDPRCLDGVPTTALAAEHSVGSARASYKKAPTSSTRTHSNTQIITTSPFWKTFSKMDASQIKNFVSKSKNCPKNNILNKFRDHLKNINQKALCDKLSGLKQRRQQEAAKKVSLCESLKEHGGPLQTPEAVENVCSKFSLVADEDRKHLEKIIALELSFQKIIVNNKSIDQKLFRQRFKDQATGRYIKISVETRIQNLKEIVSPIADEIQFEVVSPSEFVEKANDHHTVMTSYPHRINPSNSSDCNDIISTDSSEPDASINTHFAEADYVAAYFIGEDRLWYPGIVSKVVNSNSCSDCKSLKDLSNDADGNKCYLTKFFTELNDEVFELNDTTEYHVHPSQLLIKPIIEYVKLEPNNTIGYKILNAKEVDNSINQNVLFRCMQSDE